MAQSKNISDILKDENRIEDALEVADAAQKYFDEAVEQLKAAEKNVEDYDKSLLDTYNQLPDFFIGHKYAPEEIMEAYKRLKTLIEAEIELIKADSIYNA